MRAEAPSNDKMQKIALLKRKSFWTVVIIMAAVGSVVGILAIQHGNDEKRYEDGVTNMRATLEEATTDFLGPRGAIEHLHATVIQGERIPMLGVCIDVGCPEIESQWYLLADRDQEEILQNQVKNAVLTKQESAKWHVDSIVGVLGESEQPYPPPTDKEWFNIMVWLSASRPEDVYKY